MVRVLILIAISGFILSVATLTAAFAIGGADAITGIGWSMASNGHWNGPWSSRHWDWDDDDWDRGPNGPEITRTLAWSGGDTLDVDISADVEYTQAPGDGSVVVTGPQRLVDRVVVENGHIRYDRDNWSRRHGQRLKIVMRAANVKSFDLSGRSELSIADYRQDELRIDISGSGKVVASGVADTVEVDISGSGDADLASLKSKGADVEISGSGEAIISPTEWAKLEISGRGDVTLTTHPPKLSTDVSGSGEVHQSSRGDDSDTPSPSPSPSPTPAKKT